MTSPHPPQYRPQPPAPKSNTWIVWLVMGVIGVVCCLPSAMYVAFQPDTTARIVRQISSVLFG